MKNFVRTLEEFTKDSPDLKNELEMKNLKDYEVKHIARSDLLKNT